MKKLLLLLPIGLLATSGIYWVTAMQTPPAKPSATYETSMPKESRELFSYTDHCLNQIVRHGDYKSISLLNTSLNAISTHLSKNKQQGYNVTEIENMLSQYKEDSALLTEKFANKLPLIAQYDQFEEKNEKVFLLSLEQIGLYELKTTYSNLNTLRKNFIKKPSNESKTAYMNEYSHVKKIISELYLDSTIEQPIFAYLENHKHYFDIIDSAYVEIGYDRINRLENSSYAIESELQLLPST